MDNADSFALIIFGLFSIIAGIIFGVKMGWWLFIIGMLAIFWAIENIV